MFQAAILQQTAEYIYSLEQEKTRLLSQNCQLKRLLNQHEGNEAPTKKRKNESGGFVITNVGESSDEGIDTMSPEPVTGIITITPTSTTAVQSQQQQITSNTVVSQTVNNNAELMEIKAQLERERRMRLLLEDQLRTLESQVVYSSTVYHENTEEAVLVTLPEDMQVVSMESVPPVAQTQTVESCPLSRSPSPQRLPSALEAAIKAEPKVDVERVERIPSPTPHDDVSARLYVPNTSRQNLETIVEAIRHLEGDHLFEESNGKRNTTVVAAIAPAQDVPLALTTKPKPEITQRLLQVEMDPFLHFHTTVQQQQQTRPGVIVVKQHS